MKIMLAHHSPPGVSSGLESEIGRPPTLLSLARQGNLYTEESVAVLLTSGPWAPVSRPGMS